MKYLAFVLSLVLAFSSTQTVAAKEQANKGSTVKTTSEQVISKVNINTASAEQLAAVLTGVGVKKAQAIVEYRSKFGPFKSLNELTAVKGIGQKTVEKNKHKIQL